MGSKTTTTKKTTHTVDPWGGVGGVNYSFAENGCVAYGPVHEISNNVVCATSKASDQPAYMRSLIRAFASCLSIL